MIAAQCVYALLARLVSTRSIRSVAYACKLSLIVPVSFVDGWSLYLHVK